MIRNSNRPWTRSCSGLKTLETSKTTSSEFNVIHASLAIAVGRKGASLSTNYSDVGVFVICAGRYRVEREVNEVRVKYLVDSGAAITLMRIDIWERISKSHPKKLCAYKTTGLVGVEGSSLDNHGCATVSYHLGNREIETDVVVVSTLFTDAILGVDFRRNGTYSFMTANK